MHRAVSVWVSWDMDTKLEIMEQRLAYSGVLAISGLWEERQTQGGAQGEAELRFGLCRRQLQSR